jgi:hypothetical protein
MMLRYGVLVAALLSVTSHATAEVVRIEIASRADVQMGKAFGDTGSYEEIVGRVYYSLDPDNAHNKSIVDLDKAPHNAAGQVTFSADLHVLAPKDTARGNGVALFDVLNRGRKNILRDFNRAPPSFAPNAALDLGGHHSVLGPASALQRCATSHPRSKSRARRFRRAMPTPMALHRMDVFYGSFCTRVLMPTRRTCGPLMV